MTDPVIPTSTPQEKGSTNVFSAPSEATVFDGRGFAQAKLNLVRQRVAFWQQSHAVGLRIVSIYPHEDEASVLYTKLKKQDAAGVGIEYQTVPLSLQASRHDWLRAIMNANQDPMVQAILVQKPSRSAYAAHTTEKSLEFSTWWQNIAEAIASHKDIDGLAPMTLFTLETMATRVTEGQRPLLESLSEYLLPATAQAVVDICLSAFGNNLSILRQKKVAVIGKSVIVGAPAAAGLQALGVNVVLLSRKDDLSAQLPSCDVIISATGQANLISPDMVKSGAVLIDVGAPVAEFQSGCYAKAAFYTPVPYGVGPVTRACLLENIFKLPTLSRYAVVR